MGRRYTDDDIASIGYKIMKGDWVVCQTPVGEKMYRVTKVTSTRAIVEFGRINERARKSLRFPRHYSIPFLPLTKKTKPDYVSPNKWFVVMSKNISHLRLRYD